MLSAFLPGSTPGMQWGPHLALRERELPRTRSRKRSQSHEGLLGARLHQTPSLPPGSRGVGSTGPAEEHYGSTQRKPGQSAGPQDTGWLQGCPPGAACPAAPVWASAASGLSLCSRDAPGHARLRARPDVSHRRGVESPAPQPSVTAAQQPSSEPAQVPIGRQWVKRTWPVHAVAPPSPPQDGATASAGTGAARPGGARRSQRSRHQL